jgi:Sec-independent protein secretion pathway component TatC
MSFSSSKEMPLRQHIEELRSRILHIVISVIIVTVFTMSFGIKPLELGGIFLFYYPYPDPFHNIAIQITKFMQETLLPAEVKLSKTNSDSPWPSILFSNIRFYIDWRHRFHANNCQGNIWFHFTGHRRQNEN